MDFEHHVQNKKADIALLHQGKPQLIVETKDLNAQLDDHVTQGLEYAFGKGVEWVILTNGMKSEYTNHLFLASLILKTDCFLALN
jgi:predicted type IV restriction endonuclease